MAMARPGGTSVTFLKHSKKREDADKSSKSVDKIPVSYVGKSGNQSTTNDVIDKLGQLTINSNNERTEALPKNILYYGWFFDKETSKSIKETAEAYLLSCLKVREFRKFMDNACAVFGVTDPVTFYRHPRAKKSSDFQYHVTAKFLGREENKEYSSLAEKFTGTKFDIHLVEMFFTDKSCGIRVDLTRTQKVLFDERDGGDCPSLATSDDLPSRVVRELDHNQITEKLETTPKLSKRPVQIQSLISNLGGIKFVPLDKDAPTPSSKSSRAHVTVGCAPKVRPKQTGDDLLGLADLEECQTKFRDYSIDEGTLRRVGENAFVLYPSHKIVAAAVFNYFI